MSRLLLGLVGLLVAMIPDRTLQMYELLAMENPDACTAKWWVVPGIRAEGAAITVLSLVGGKGYTAYMALVGVTGVFAVVSPQKYAETGFGLAYDDIEDVEWSEGFLTAVRVLGAIGIILALRALRGARNSP